jgi:hypothetical protein
MVWIAVPAGVVSSSGRLADVPPSAPGLHLAMRQAGAQVDVGSPYDLAFTSPRWDDQATIPRVIYG